MRSTTRRNAALLPSTRSVDRFSLSLVNSTSRSAEFLDTTIALMKKSASAGFGFNPAAGSNLLGIGVNWGEPSESFGMDLHDQYAVEAFYRLQLSDETTLTTDVQLLLDPALNPEVDSIWVLGLRVRIAL